MAWMYLLREGRAALGVGAGADDEDDGKDDTAMLFSEDNAVDMDWGVLERTATKTDRCVENLNPCKTSALPSSLIEFGFKCLQRLTNLTIFSSWGIHTCSLIPNRIDYILPPGLGSHYFFFFYYSTNESFLGVDLMASWCFSTKDVPSCVVEGRTSPNPFCGQKWTIH